MLIVECVFCKIVAGQIEAHRRYEDDEVMAFDDISRDAPVHVLVIPKIHVENTARADERLLGKLQKRAEALAEELKISDEYQIFLNGGRLRGVAHLHYHLKGGMS